MQQRPKHTIDVEDARKEPGMSKIQVIVGTRRTLSPAIFHRLTEYRYRVFVERLGWPLKNSNRQELDQFDRDDTIYVVFFNSDHDIIATSRLLPTTKPYLLSEVFPDLMGGASAPRSPRVWELSRFATVDFSCKNSYSEGQFSADLTLSLLEASATVASIQGATRLITVSPLAVERLLRKTKFRSKRAGPSILVNEHQLVAFWIDI